MNERLIVKSFGPVKDIDITFKKITIFIGDQGTGKSCVAKLFSMFKWLEKQLSLRHQTAAYYVVHDRFRTKLCAYHRIDSFINDETYIKYCGEAYDFEYIQGTFLVSENKGKGLSRTPKIMYVPAERSILSIAENRPRLLKELPDSCETFFDEMMNAKRHFKNGYDLPFGVLHFDKSQNNTGWILGENYKVRLINASSGIQSALPLCMVSEYLSRKVLEKEEMKLSKEERMRMEKRIAEIIQNEDYSDSVKDIMLKQLSATTRYECFINIAEEPELNLFPQSQINVLCSLVKNNASSSGNMLVITTHSPYTLAIFNMMIMAAKVACNSDDEIKAEVAKIIPAECHITPESISAFRLSEKENVYCKSILSETSNLISKNDLDIASEDIMQRFNALCRLYAKSFS